MLSAKKTPTLCRTLPAFEALISTLKKYQNEHSYEIYDIIQDGIEKLDKYQQEISNIPAYTLAISK
jgi:hypothetical protein